MPLLSITWTKEAKYSHSMSVRKIQGLTKAEFLDMCLAKADELNPNWEQDYFHVNNFVPKTIWVNSGESSGFALTPIGGRFFECALQLEPYYIETHFMYSKDHITLSRRMPWPYTAGRFDGSLITKIGIFSREVAVWAALYDNDLEKLLQAYSR